MRRSCIFLLPMMILLLCGTGHANEHSVEVEQRVGAIEEETNALEQEVLTHPTDEETLREVMAMLLTIERGIAGLKEEIKTHETCVGPTGGRNWEQFLDKLDRHNGDQAM